DAGGQATCSTSALTVAGSPHEIKAEYRNGSNFADSDGILAGGQTVNKASTSVTNVTASTSTFGGTSNLSATVSPTGVSGSVNFYVNGSSTPIAAVYDSTTGAASVSNYTHGLNANATPYSVRAVFTSGDTNYNGSEATNASGLTVAKASVTATAGSGSATYDGATKSPSACVVSGTYTGDLTCANSPASVGPAAGTTTIVPVVS